MNLNDMREKLLISLSEIYDSDMLSPLLKFLQGEQRVMSYLFRHTGEDIFVSRLSKELSVSKARITAILNSLKKKDRITLTMCEHDRRRILVSLTEKGWRYAEEQQLMAFEYFDRLIMGLGEKDTGELIRLIGRAREIIEDKETKE